MIEDVRFELLNELALSKLSEKHRFFHEVSAKQGLGDYMSLVKIKARDEVIKNKNPDQPWKQKSVAGRVTYRTGALYRGLTEGIRAEKTYWKNLDKKNTTTNEKLKTLFGKMRRDGNNIVGSWSVFVRDGSAALKAANLKTKTFKKKDSTVISGDQMRLRTNKKQILFRFLWERRGRPFIRPAHDKYYGRLTGFMKKAFGNLPQILGMK